MPDHFGTLLFLALVIFDNGNFGPRLFQKSQDILDLDQYDSCNFCSISFVIDVSLSSFHPHDIIIGPMSIRSLGIWVG